MSIIPDLVYQHLHYVGAAAILGPGTPVSLAAIKIMELLMQKFE